MFLTSNHPATNTAINSVNHMATMYKTVFEQIIRLLGNIGKKMCYQGPVMNLLIKHEGCIEVLTTLNSPIGINLRCSYLSPLLTFSGSGFFEPSWLLKEI